MVESMSEESATGYTHHFPEELPSRTNPPPAAGGWRGRLRSRFWTFSLSSYDIIHAHDGQVRLRHMAMIAILVLRTAMSALSILSAIIKKNVAGIIVYSLLAILSFWFTATCLAIIGDAAGDRRVTGMIIVSYEMSVRQPAVLSLMGNLETLAFRCLPWILPHNPCITHRAVLLWLGRARPRVDRSRYVAPHSGRCVDWRMGA